ncbi:type II toxin-antitoxin system VapC family toxin [Salinisphaera sp.]|uniref:type II toxin-antitoxin system VapC family toxin n=1 Tax=Salinisphaera sp. TaxID=1914330 RepID=UPI002D7916CD|nr:type II toxin-antitoxin system VapC family toxin [Salinisphaera sp.]HET7313455.1 type II toxin-antitoxin system VapC family toxin [Salinisphaera sp.]
MNVVDSSGWLTYFADDEHADYFAEAIEQTDRLIVPSLSLYEVFKRVLQQRGEDAALQAVAVMQQGRVIAMDASTALLAAKLSHESKLAMADSVMLATARLHNATLWTQDADFAAFNDVRFRRK